LLELPETGMEAHVLPVQKYYQSSAFILLRDKRPIKAIVATVEDSTVDTITIERRSALLNANAIN
jgi:hypothetical protein